jgi:2-polyprenyl-3-methyl-5-hydroxy-6-metoxy-1,4-benzoquinol methylase
MYKKDDCLQRDFSPHSPHTIIPSLVKPNKTVLDVGCNIGMIAQELQDNDVDGIDINDDALEIAKKYCRKVFKRDLYKNELNIPKQKYDYILFADVLEHLPRPDLILKDTKQYLNKNGRVIISLPNIARIELRIKHLMGDFTYAPGIMSLDHLRFFTKKTAIELIEEAGYRVETIIPTGLGHRFPYFTTLIAFQFIFVCKLK